MALTLADVGRELPARVADERCGVPRDGADDLPRSLDAYLEHNGRELLP